MTFLTGLAQSKSKGGYFPIALINYEERYFIVFTSAGKEKIKFNDVCSLNYSSNIPILVIPE